MQHIFGACRGPARLWVRRAPFTSGTKNAIHGVGADNPVRARFWGSGPDVAPVIVSMA